MSDYDNNLNNLEESLKEWRGGAINPVTRIFWEMNAEIIRNLSIEYSHRGDNVLDVGCGVGSYIIELANRGRKSYGVDPLFETSLLLAKENVSSKNVDVELFRGCGEHLPFRDNMFNMILCVSTLQHVEDQNLVLQKIRGLLKNDGFLLVSVPQTIRKSSFENLEIYTMHFNSSILVEMIENAGFEVVTMRYCGFMQPLVRRFLNVILPVIGLNGVRSMFVHIDSLTHMFPQYASSVILLARVRS